MVQGGTFPEQGAEESLGYQALLLRMRSYNLSMPRQLTLNIKLTAAVIVVYLFS